VHPKNSDKPTQECGWEYQFVTNRWVWCITSTWANNPQVAAERNLAGAVASNQVRCNSPVVELNQDCLGMDLVSVTFVFLSLMDFGELRVT